MLRQTPNLSRDCPGLVRCCERLSLRLCARKALGLAGSYVGREPTFVPTESALDAGPGERPPFDEWYARPSGAPALRHDEPDAAAVRFMCRVLISSFSPQNSQLAASAK